jgi:hypothetical protein
MEGESGGGYLAESWAAHAGQFREESLESPAAGRPRDQGKTDDWSLYPICFRSPPPTTECAQKTQRRELGGGGGLEGTA